MTDIRVHLSPRFVFLLALGLALGFVAAGLTTEIYEEIMIGEPRYDDDGRFTGMDTRWEHGTLTALQVTTTVAVFLAIAYGAYRLRDRDAGGFLAALAISTPVWYAFYEVDHTEAAMGVTLAMAATWVGIGLLDAPRVRAAALAGGLLAAGVSIAWLEAPVWVMPLAIGSVVGVIGVEAMGRNRHRAAMIGIFVWAGVFLALSATPSIQGASLGGLWVLGAGAVALATLAWAGWRFRPEAT